jgi:NADPH-dependent 2,4-dienoyl-CoA reductase/sulfur reductase-like enzyme
VQNARAGNEHLSRTCIACNWCAGATGDGAQGCTINPASYRERLWGVATFSFAPRLGKVVIVGAGPGGLEAARVAALRGHRVTLLEQRDRLGGGLASWASLPGRETVSLAVDWWASELKRLNVEVRLGSSVTAEDVLDLVPDAVIVATGARYSPGGRCITRDADIPGHEREHVFCPEDILLGGDRPMGKVLLADGEGHHTSCGIAELLAASGADLTYVTAGFSPVSARLVDSFEAPFVIRRMKQAGVRFAPGEWLREIGETVVRLYDVHTEEERLVEADAVVLSTGREPVDALARALEGKVRQLFTIGDALAARPLAAATYEGQKFARLIGEDGAPATFAEAFFSRDDPLTTPLPADFERPAARGQIAGNFPGEHTAIDEHRRPH